MTNDAGKRSEEEKKCGEKAEKSDFQDLSQQDMPEPGHPYLL